MSKELGSGMRANGMTLAIPAQMPSRVSRTIDI